MRFEYADTHAYPGCPVRVVGEDLESRREGPAEIEFSDGQLVAGRWSRADEALLVEIDAYRTARGASIPARRWRLQDDGHPRWKVAARLG